MEVSLRCHNSPRRYWVTGCGVTSTYRKRAEFCVRIWRGKESSTRTPNEKDRLLELAGAGARRTCVLWGGGALAMGAKWIRQHRRLSPPYVETFNSKLIKKVSYLNKKSLHFFEFRDSYVISLWTLYVHFAHSVNCEYGTLWKFGESGVHLYCHYY